jgi:hypothetical protein
MNKTALTFVNLSLTAALTFATLTLATAGAHAEEINDQTLTLAAADVGVKTVWVETQEDAEARIADELTEKTDVLSEKANAKLEQKLEAKLAQEFAL